MSETSSPFPFVVVGGARSGTTLLKNLLRSHPNLLSFSELFCPGRIYWDYPDMEHMETQETVTWRDAHPVEFMKAVYESEHEARSKVSVSSCYTTNFSARNSNRCPDTYSAWMGCASFTSGVKTCSRRMSLTASEPCAKPGA